MKSKLFTFLKLHWIFFACFLLFAILLARNPFSERTQIPNFEPYPDSFHYILPARNLLMGKGFTMDRIGHILPGVPPFYSLVFIPFFLVFNDPRMVYVVNAFLSLAALVFFYLIVRKLFKAEVLRLFMCILFVTHPILVWYPTLAMAENLQLLLTVAGLYVLLTPTTIAKNFWGGVLSVSFYATKFASLPVSAAYGFIFLIKSIAESLKAKSWKTIGFFMLGAMLCASLYLAMEYSIRQTTEFHTLAAMVFPKPATDAAAATPAVGPDQTFFSPIYIKDHAPQYMRWLLGHPLTILWKQERLLPMALSVISILGVGVGLLSKKYRLFSITALFTYIATILFMSMFYVVDARYFYHAIPFAILGIGVFFSQLYSVAKSKSLFVGIIIFGILGLYLATNAMRLKFQVSLNLKYAETPWYYSSVRRVDDYIASNGPYEKQPIVISPVPPFLFDFYAKSSMTLLPLHADQEFRNAKTQTWGEHDYKNLHTVYTDYLNQGYPVFVSTYGLGNEGFLHQALERMQTSFTLTQVMDECHGLCKLYRVDGVKN